MSKELILTVICPGNGFPSLKDLPPCIHLLKKNTQNNWNSEVFNQTFYL